MLVLGLFGGSTGGGELLLVFVVALLLFGSRNLPRIARSLGRAIEEFRRAARSVSDEIMRGGDAGREPPAEPHIPGAPRAAGPGLPGRRPAPPPGEGDKEASDGDSSPPDA
jgi:TatA/E family protein of Tat protein translocase